MEIVKLPQAAQQAAGGRGARCKPRSGVSQAHFKPEIAEKQSTDFNFFCLF